MKGQILVVEDEADIRVPLAILLESEGYEVLLASNGREALNQLATGIHPSLIVLDMKMPEMSGWEFAEAYYAARDHETPILVMTAAADAEARAQEIHADHWIGKPFRLDEIIEKVHRFARPTSDSAAD